MTCWTEVPVEGKVYKHYKGGFYLVLHVAKDHETKKKLVVYKDPNAEIYVRPAVEFMNHVYTDTGRYRRFTETEYTKLF